MKESTECPPVLFLIFNRPKLTQRVFERIRQAGPQQLFIAADGSRPDVPADKELCLQARKIVEQVDWKCEVYTLFRERNLGCKQAVSSAIDWFFTHVEAGIILEDDCLPHPTFFRFCEELLAKYRDDKRIMAISGNNFQFGRQRTQYSYYFSRYPHCWGWATWQRAWRHYDIEIKLWPEIRDHGWLWDILGDERAVSYWTNIFDRAYKGEIDAWTYGWLFTCWIESGLTILPNVNLVSNIGFDPEGTHTKSAKTLFANMPIKAMSFPLSHPPIVVRDAQADAFTQIQNFSSSKYFRLKRKLVSIYRWFIKQ